MLLHKKTQAARVQGLSRMAHGVDLHTSSTQAELRAHTDIKDQGCYTEIFTLFHSYKIIRMLKVSHTASEQPNFTHLERERHKKQEGKRERWIRFERTLKQFKKIHDHHV